jgi:hypothetical protein
MGGTEEETERKPSAGDITEEKSPSFFCYF